jgi:hypothetical protein
MDLRIAHDRMGSSADPSLNGHLEYPNNLDQSLNDAVTDKNLDGKTGLVPGLVPGFQDWKCPGTLAQPWH